MKEIKLTIDGKEVQLTDEQLKVLEIEIEGKRKNPFERVAKTEMYCYIDSFDEVHCIADDADQDDDRSFKCSNYFNDEQFANQVVLHQLLYRKLLKFAYENECEDREWGTKYEHWRIYYDTDTDKFDIDVNDVFKYQGVYFSTREGAECAIEEVVKPFIKEHPDFVW